jgi:hypothetical protein
MKNIKYEVYNAMSVAALDAATHSVEDAVDSYISGLVWAITWDSISNTIWAIDDSSRDTVNNTIGAYEY